MKKIASFLIKTGSILLFFLILCSCTKNDLPEPIVENPIELEVKQKVLIEKISSIDCGSCPLAHWEFDQLDNLYGDDLIGISHYLFGPLHHDVTEHLLSKINKTYFTPLGLVNRREKGEGTVFFQTWSWQDELKFALEQKAKIGIGITSNFTENDLKIDIYIDEVESIDDAPLRVHAFIVEKSVSKQGLGYDQRNYGNEDPAHPYYEQDERIVGFEHKNIIRSVITPYDGQVISFDDKKFKASFNLSFELEDAKSAEDYKIVAFVANGEVPILGNIVNAQQAEFGQEKTMFE